jgi:carbon monoxide dehydrogenase subunit G
MKVVGIERLEMPAAEAWSRLSDVGRLGNALPAVQVVDVEAPDRFTAAFRPQTGLGATPLTMTFTVVERVDPQRLRVQGSGGASEYAVAVDASFELVADGDATQVHWSVDVHVHGVLRSLTQRVLPQLVRHQVAGVLETATVLQAA